MIDKTIRRLFIDCPNMMKAAQLTGNQIQVFRVVEQHPSMTAAFLQHIRSYRHVQQASAILAVLYKKGYLARKRVSCPTGGHIYVYTSALS